MIGTTFKSKINGALLAVGSEFEDNGKKYYYILDIASGRCFPVEKEYFEKRIMQNLEVVTNQTEKGSE